MEWNCILFDLDGTLLDTSKGVLKAVDYTIDALHLPKIEEKVKETFIGPPIYESFRNVYDMNQMECNMATEIFRNAYKDKFLLEAKPYEGIYDLLDVLQKSECKLAVATNKRHDYTMMLLEYYNFPQYFDFILGSDFANKMTKADIIVECLKQMQCVQKNKAIIIGDTIHDYNGAQKAGIEFAGVDYGFGLHKEEERIQLRNYPIFSELQSLKSYLMR